jgi:peptidyl-prolyl cis-trans isomerase SurA
MRRTLYVRAGLAAAAGVLACAALAAQSAPVLVDRVVAVVNNQPILLSDVRSEMRLASLEPRSKDEGEPTEQSALEDLISRALIRQQIREQDVQAAEPRPEQVKQRLAELRRELPECVHLHCSTDAGWQAFLREHGLTQVEVEHYLRMRMEVLAFIEDRFRQGIRIPQEDVEKYYRETLLPQYPKGEPAPKLENVEPRIEEILLEQRVNELFEAWLENLRRQGDVEVLDPALKTAADNANGNGGGE